MKYIIKFTSVFIILFLLNCSTETEKILQINGEVIRTETKSIILVKPNQDMRFDSLIKIPVKNENFILNINSKTLKQLLFFLEKLKKMVADVLCLYF